MTIVILIMKEGPKDPYHGIQDPVDNPEGGTKKIGTTEYRVP